MKIAIIGGGPAGLSAAIQLSKNFKHVTLYETFSIGENIICAEGFFDFYGDLDIDLPLTMKISKIIIHDYENIEVNLPKSSKFFTFDRATWQKKLKETALSQGVILKENIKVDKSLFVELQKNNDYVIDATGVKGLSHFLLSKKDISIYRKGLMPTYQYTLKGDFSNFEGRIKVIVLNKPAGYYWFFPKTVDHRISLANVGVGFLAKSSKMPNLKNILDELIHKENLAKFEIVSKKSSPIPTKRLKHYKINNVILTGDSLGLCSPLHGGGIDTAYLSGLFVAQAITKNDFSIYENFLKNLDKRFTKEKIIVTLWNFCGSQRILSRLKNKGLFSDNHYNSVPFSDSWLKKALLRLVF